MDPIRWLIRAKRWAQNPPSMRQVIFYAAIIAVCLTIAGIEWNWGWPAWLTPDRMRVKP